MVCWVNSEGVKLSAEDEEDVEEVLAIACLPGSLPNDTNRNPRAVRRMHAIVAEMQPWLPYCNRRARALMLWFKASQVLSKEGLNESPRYAPAQLSVAS
jgi:hypothetical protein